MKKVKLFTTIASLCLAVALMALGVYAATQASFNVGGSISFSATDVTGSWTWKVEIDESSTATAAFAEGVTTSGDFDDFIKDGENDGPVDVTGINVKVTAAGTVVLKITVSFTNTSSKTGTLTATKVTAENCTIADVAAVNWGAKDAANDTAEIVATVNYECQADTDLTATYNVKFEAKANA